MVSKWLPTTGGTTTNGQGERLNYTTCTSEQTKMRSVIFAWFEIDFFILNSFVIGFQYSLGKNGANYVHELLFDVFKALHSILHKLSNQHFEYIKFQVHSK